MMFLPHSPRARRLLGGVTLSVLLVAAVGLYFGAGQALFAKSPAALVVLTGVIYDEYTMQPVADVDIFPDPVSEKVATTDKQGRFTFPVPAGATMVQVLPFNTKIVGRSVFVDVQEFAKKPLTIVVERGMTVRVTVRDKAGKPIKDANPVYMPGGGISASTDAQGVAMVGPISRFRDGTLTVTAPGFKTWQRTGIYAPLYMNDGITVTMTPEPTR